MASVAWNELVAHLVGRSTDPGLGGQTAVAEDNLVFVDWRDVLRTVEAALDVNRLERLHHQRTAAAVAPDLVPNLPSGGAEALLLRGHESGVAGEVVLVVVREIVADGLRHFILI